MENGHLIKCGYSKCTKTFEPQRKHKKYCCSNHQVYAFREREKIAKATADKERETRLKNWAGQLKRIAPKSARGLDDFFEQYEADPVCCEMALKLVFVVARELAERKPT